MRPRFLADENLPRSLVQRLRDKGHDTVSASESDRSGTPDPTILTRARRDRRIIIS